MIEINPDSEQPIADQIVDQFRLKIISGDLSQGDKLPSVRELAFILSVNSKTISRAYGKLTDLGLVIAQRGKGLFVEQGKINGGPAEQWKELDNAIDIFVKSIIGLNFTSEEVSLEIYQRLEQIYQGKEGNGNG